MGTGGFVYWRWGCLLQHGMGFGALGKPSEMEEAGLDVHGLEDSASCFRMMMNSHLSYLFRCPSKWPASATSMFATRRETAGSDSANAIMTCHAFKEYLPLFPTVSSLVDYSSRKPSGLVVLQLNPRRGRDRHNPSAW